MDIVLLRNFSVHNKINKNVSEVRRFSAVRLPEATDDHDVSIRFTIPTDELRWDKVNYFSFDGAYYFLNSVEKMANGVSVVHGTMDLLMTYRNAIANLRVHVVRSSSAGQPRLEDTLRSVSVDAVRTVVRFPNKPSGSEADGLYTLVTSQDGYDGGMPQ